MLDPYAMPNIVAGGKIGVLMEGERDITEITVASVTYRKEGESVFTNYVSYEGGAYTMKIEVGNDLRGRQSKEYEIKCPVCGRICGVEGSVVYCPSDECGYEYDLDGEDLDDLDDYDGEEYE